MWPHSFLISLLLQLSLSLLTRGLSHHYLFPLCWAKTSKLHCFFFFTLDFLPSFLAACFFCFTTQQSLFYHILSTSPFAFYSAFFPSHVSLLCFTLGAEPGEQHIGIQNHVPTCLWVSACPWTPVCAWGCGWGRPLSSSLISTSTVPVCWHPAIHTHTVPLHLLRDSGRG